MSNQVNTDLFERARQVQIDFEGTPLVDAIDNCIERNDLKVLEFMVREAELDTERWEHQVEPMTDERAEAMFKEANDVY